MAIRRHIDARLHAIARDVGIHQMLKAQFGKLRHGIVERHARAVAPAVHPDLAVARGNVSHQQLAKALGRHLGKTRLGHQHGAQRNAACAVACQLVDACKRANAAALVLAKGSGQVDDVHPARTLLGKGAGNGHGVVGIYLAAAAVAAL